MVAGFKGDVQNSCFSTPFVNQRLRINTTADSSKWGLQKMRQMKILSKRWSLAKSTIFGAINRTANQGYQVNNTHSITEPPASYFSALPNLINMVVVWQALWRLSSINPVMPEQNCPMSMTALRGEEPCHAIFLERICNLKITKHSYSILKYRAPSVMFFCNIYPLGSFPTSCAETKRLFQ